MKSLQITGIIHVVVLQLLTGESHVQNCQSSSTSFKAGLIWVDLDQLQDIQDIVLGKLNYVPLDMLQKGTGKEGWYQ